MSDWIEERYADADDGEDITERDWVLYDIAEDLEGELLEVWLPLVMTEHFDGLDPETYHTLRRDFSHHDANGQLCTLLGRWMDSDCRESWRLCLEADHSPRCIEIQRYIRRLPYF